LIEDDPDYAKSRLKQGDDANEYGIDYNGGGGGGDI